MTTPPPALLTTGLFWHAGDPALGLADDAGRERQLRLAPPAEIGLQVAGPRRCVGTWLPERARRRPCPHRTPVAVDRRGAQCPACAGGDPGQALARDATLDDERPFALYLAYFGPDLLKVGLTAQERGGDRLAEQGALAYTWLAHGRLNAIRRTERLVAATGIAVERLSHAVKAAVLADVPTAEERHDALRRATVALAGAVPWPENVDRAPFTVHDNTAVFGLDRPRPTPTHEVRQVRPGAVVTGWLYALAGRTALLDTAAGPVRMDLRLLDGWPLTRATGPLRDVDLSPITRAGGPHEAQDPLF